MTTIRELLAPIRELETAATEGPWRWTDLGSQTRQELRNAERPLLRCSALMHPESEDAAFIAASRTTVPRLVAAIEAVEAMAEDRQWLYDVVCKNTCGKAAWGADHEAIATEVTNAIRVAVVAALEVKP